ncbi:MAG: DUF4381 domain-containing protein [Alphaproteobacteria bacterium]|nr:DUF4381 domain-containing protein [Alphaproteobacteria bacterium]
MNGEQIDLSGLKDIVVPVKPDFFPLAIGWWIVIIAVIILILVLIGFWVHYYFSPLSYALRELKKDYHHIKKKGCFAKSVSKLLKRASILKYGREKVASLSDEMWMRFLSQQSHGKIKLDVIKFIAFSSYLPDNQTQVVSDKKIYDAAKILVKNILKDKKK